MQNRFVVTGNIQETQQVLLAYELLENEFKINLHVVDKKILSPEQTDALLNKWVAGEDFIFPDGTQLINPDINEDSILPENIKTEKTGEIRHFQNEWAVQLLTNKLWEVYLNRLEELKAEAETLNSYSRELFDDTKAFWEQVLENKKERNITQSRLDKIKEDVNAIFEKLKTFRKTESEEFDKASKAALDQISQKLEDIKKKVEAKANFKALADEIKQIQYNFRQQRFSKSHEAAVRKAFDDTFHFLNEARKSYFSNRNEGRVAGLQEVIKKMEAGLARDKSDFDYFTAKIERPKIQSLELQLLKVRLRQIKETIDSKEEKLKDIYKTMESLMKSSPKETVEVAENSNQHVLDEQSAKIEKKEAHTDSTSTSDVE
jgi:hypothetical protein